LPSPPGASSCGGYATGSELAVAEKGGRRREVVVLLLVVMVMV